MNRVPLISLNFLHGAVKVDRDRVHITVLLAVNPRSALTSTPRNQSRSAQANHGLAHYLHFAVLLCETSLAFLRRWIQRIRRRLF
jgi:hypothetical protein